MIRAPLIAYLVMPELTVTNWVHSLAPHAVLDTFIQRLEQLVLPHANDANRAPLRRLLLLAFALTANQEHLPSAMETLLARCVALMSINRIRGWTAVFSVMLER